jgi:hypothetical protein
VFFPRDLQAGVWRRFICPLGKARNNCHANADVFLLEGDVPPEEREANQSGIVTQLPPELPAQ